METKSVGVLGGGAWGTGLAQALAVRFEPFQLHSIDRNTHLIAVNISKNFYQNTTTLMN